MTYCYQSVQELQPIHIREARPEDAAQLLEMHQRASAASLYDRYATPYTPTLADMEEITRLQPDEGEALVALSGGMLVGVAYYVVTGREPEATAEPAVLIEDHCQGQGIGTLLMEALLQQAKAQGISNISAFVHAGNGRMMRLLRRLSLPMTRRFTFGGCEFLLQLGQ